MPPLPPFFDTRWGRVCVFVGILAAPGSSAALPKTTTTAAGLVPSNSVFDASKTPWGGGRKSSGEAFRSARVPLEPGAFRWLWDGASLGVGGQYFVRGEARGNADFLSGSPDSAQQVDQRARFLLRGSLREQVGFLIELQDVRAWGSEPNTITTTPNTGLHQGFVDFRAAPWLDLRIGRQELSYGEDRLIGTLDWAQSARAFNGVFARATADSFTLDTFAMLLKPPGFLNQEGSGARFRNSGCYFVGSYARYRAGFWGVDVYVLGLLEDKSTPLTGRLADENRVTLGARAFGTWGGLSLVGEGAYQGGRQRAEGIQAGAFAGRASYTLDIFGAPYLLAEISGATGDGDSSDGRATTFHQLFPTAHLHLGFMDYVAWQNVLAFRGTVGWKPAGVHVWLDVHRFHLWDPKGAWFAANGSTLMAADPTRTQAAMGTEFDLSVTVPIHEQVSIASAFAMFLPGAAASSKGSDPSTWAFLYLRSQF